ncbi:pyridoxamine 5'-phosphate oxidase family protein [Streptomyces sp. NPDC006733]|uniref:pyridoxamine 5'-phosphate oxidase family protein n=1 Tax=Streptomyces sp. NPDC006733 TaxID=3155460 RepID=UPI0033CCF86E
MHRHNGFRELDRQECLRLLSLATLGRVIYTEDALPSILPVHFHLDADGAVLFQASAASHMARAVQGAVVAFEADHFDEAGHTGWSVVVTGRASVVTNPVQQERLRSNGPRPWLETDDGVFIRIGPELVAGRVVDRNGYVPSEQVHVSPADMP